MSDIKAWSGDLVLITGGNPRYTDLTGRVEHVNKNGSARVRLDTLPGLTGRLVTIQQNDLQLVAKAATPPDITARLEYLRGELRAERISYGELIELQNLAPHIEPGDTELLEAAGVPEFPDTLAEAIDATPAGHLYADRELLNIARLGLSRIYTGPEREVSEGMRECARQALARLEGRISLTEACQCCVNNECECQPGTAEWFADAKAAGCTGTGYNTEDDTIEHRDPGPCPVHPGLADMPRYIARFTPEAWVRDQAVEVDAEGPQEWDCTAYATEDTGTSRGLYRLIYLDWLERSGKGTLAGEGVLDNDDVFRDDPAAPGWIAAWQGPFTIRIRYAREGE